MAGKYGGREGSSIARCDKCVMEHHNGTPQWNTAMELTVNGRSMETSRNAGRRSCKTSSALVPQASTLGALSTRVRMRVELL